ncbi:helix-turn-helix domain-containing protein [Carnobacterium maltaromaticum]|uniref:Helix-turn-helix domain-containing protein n=1 Tax=Carnobacterium maltaromaticum TaxID=2751 RepID=A0AAW9K7E8_CARML|nr:helix-turn-helix domain-containing protein [Carnobacterium maltaromaticum]MDZ5759687.1 helix-turn-helix domain-containing protein [Carnobacterium maltaromaticum]
MNSFLSKTDIRKLLLVHTIEESFQQKISISDLIERMNISEFILFSTYEELKQDIERYQLDDEIYIQKLNQNIILKKNISFSTKDLKKIYVKNSLGFQIIQDVFDEVYTNTNEYALLFFTSRTKVYNKVNELRDKLAENAIKLSSRFELIGSEKAIRIYMNNLYTYAYGNDDYPFSTILKKQVQLFITNLEKKTGRKLTQTSKIKLLYFVSICQIRIGNKKHIKLSSNTYSSNYSLNKVIKAVYQISFGKKVTENELDLLLQFIGSLDEFMHDFEMEKPDELTNFFLLKFQSYFGEIKDEQLKIRLANDLMKIHYPILMFKCLQTEMDERVKSRFIEENYPELMDFCLYIIEKAFKYKKLYLIKQNEIYLINRYIFLLINVLPINFFSLPIKICIDFTLGGNYNQFIYRNIKTFDFINIEISNQLTDDIDILLCDYTVKDLNEELKVVVWSAPPTAGDWANLGKYIINARKKTIGEEE